MFRWIILFCLLLGYEAAYAHQPDLSSTMLVEQDDNQWVLQIRSALTAFQYEVRYHFGDSAYATPEEFQDLVIQHIRDNILIKFNGANVKLKHGMVQLGHETNVVFEVSGTPKDIESLWVQNSSFSNLSHNQSALIVLKKGFTKDQFVLNNKNEHTIKLKVADNKFVIDTPLLTKDKIQTAVLLFGVIGLAIGLYFFYKKKNKNETTTA